MGKDRPCRSSGARNSLARTTAGGPDRLDGRRDDLAAMLTAVLIRYSSGNSGAAACGSGPASRSHPICCSTRNLRGVRRGFGWSLAMPTLVVGVGVDAELLEPVEDHLDGARVDVTDLSARLEDVQRDADVGEHGKDRSRSPGSRRAC